MRDTGRDKPWSKHVRYHHNGIPPATSIHALAVETNLIRRKVLEAMFIRERKPKINVKKEMDEALEFIGSCGDFGSNCISRGITQTKR
jgi:hypothetical protein